MFLVFALYALFASVFTLAKDALHYTEPLFLVGSRMVAAGTLLLSYHLFIQKKSLYIPAKDWAIFGAFAFSAIYFTNILEFWGLQYLTSFKTCFLYSLSPFISALFSYWIFKERLSSNKWLGLYIGVCGMVPILLQQTNQEELSGEIWLFSWAELAVLTAAICSVYGWIQLKQTVQRGYSPILSNGIAMLLGGGIALVHSWCVEPWSPLPISDYPHFILSTCALIVVSNLICYNLYGYLLAHYSATFMAFAGLTTPLFTSLFGWFFLQETVSWPFFLSLAILSTGLTVFHREELKPLAYEQ